MGELLGNMVHVNNDRLLLLPERFTQNRVTAHVPEDPEPEPSLPFSLATGD